MANRAREAGQPSGWFEEFYQWTAGDLGKVPWADLAPHPLLSELPLAPGMGPVAVVGAGLGDDAEWLSGFSADVWAFDVSTTAVRWAQERFPESAVQYEAADLFRLPAAELGRHALVVEIYTLQALPPEVRPQAAEALASLLAPGGELVVITRWREPETELGPVPWPLTFEELALFASLGLQEKERTVAPEGDPIRSVWRRLR